MIKVSIIGHFGFGKELLNGQTIKTKNISKALADDIGDGQILKIDTHGGFKALLKLPFQISLCLKKTENVVIMPANRGLQIITPLLLCLNKKKKRKIHYVVIGGWLPSLCLKKPKLAENIKKFDYVYVETFAMKKALEKQGFPNVVVMPNFKYITPLDSSQLNHHYSEPYKMCTFSRVMKEKGIEDAVNAVILLNKKYGFYKYTLDIYGQIDESQSAWFKKLQSTFPCFIEYKGQVSPDRSVDIIKQYYSLLFPTYYDGEGFAGTLLDAMAAGVPIIASSWKYNCEIVNHNNGVLFETKNVDELASAIDNLSVSRNECLREYNKYLPSNIVKVLIEKL